MGDAITVSLIPDLFPLMGSEAPLLARRWEYIIGGGPLTYFADTSLLLAKHRVELVTSWEAALKKLEAWGVFCLIFLGDAAVHPTTYEV